MDAGEFTAQAPAEWRVLVRSAHAWFRCGSYGAAGRFAAEVAALCDEQDHHASLAVRYPDLVTVVTTTHMTDGLTGRDLRLATAVSALAADRGHRPEPPASPSVEIGIDALDIDAVLPFWAAVLGYRPGPAVAGRSLDVRDPQGTGPDVWFQQMQAPRPQRNRIHLDVTVAHDVAEQRVADALAAGGTLVSDAAAPAYWVLADPEGNEACVCTWRGRP